MDQQLLTILSIKKYEVQEKRGPQTTVVLVAFKEFFKCRLRVELIERTRLRSFLVVAGINLRTTYKNFTRIF